MEEEVILEEIEMMTTEVSEELGNLSENMELNLARPFEDDLSSINIEEDMNNILNESSQEEFQNLLNDFPEVNQEINSLSVQVSENMMEDVGNAGGQIGVRNAEVQAGASRLSRVWGVIKVIGKTVLIVTNVYMVVDFIGRKIVDIVALVKDVNKKYDWKGELTDDDKKTLEKLSSDLPLLHTILQSWKGQWEELKKTTQGLGTISVMVGGKPTDVPVIDVVYFTLSDMEQQCQEAQKLLNKEADQLTIFNIRVALNKVFIVLADARSLFQLQSKQKSGQMKLWGFPPKEDEAKINQMIDAFPNGKQQIKQMSISYMNFVAKNTVKTYVSVKATQNIYEQIENVCLPEMKKAAKSAAEQAAKNYIDSKKAGIIATAFIPIVGDQKAREAIEEAKKEATKRGSAAGVKAAKEKMNELMPQVKAKAAALTKQAVGDNKEAVKQLVKMALEDAKKNLLETKSK